LPSQLLWSHHHFYSASYSDKHKMRPRSKPTWSWASPDCRVELPYYCDAAQNPDFVTKNDHSLRKPVDFNVPTLVEALGVQITLHDKDPTGLVDGGWIRLRCNELLPMFRSPAIGWSLSTDPPPALQQIPPIRWTWGDPEDAISDVEREIWRKAHVGGEFSQFSGYSCHHPHHED
jgi:hypothetical protein